MDDNKHNQDKGGPWWKEAAFLFSEISAWIVVPIIGALLAGKALDAHYGTAPWLFMVCAALGFLITAYGIIRAVKKYAKSTKVKTDKFGRVDKELRKKWEKPEE